VRKLPIVFDYFGNALEKSLHIKVKSVESTVAVTCNDDEIMVSSLAFSGYYSGSLFMILKKAQKASIVKSVLENFSIDEAISDEAVFSEILNILSGAVITEFAKEDKYMNISPPIYTLDHSFDKKPTETVIITDERQFVYKFCLFLRNNSDD